MKRLFWVAVGAGLAVVAVRKLSEAKERYVPAPALDAASTVLHLRSTVRTARADFVSGMAERTAALREQLVGDPTAAGDPAALRDAAAALRRRREHRADAAPAQASLVDVDDDELPYSFF